MKSMGAKSNIVCTPAYAARGNQMLAVLRSPLTFAEVGGIERLLSKQLALGGYHRLHPNLLTHSCTLRAAFGSASGLQQTAQSFCRRSPHRYPGDNMVQESGSSRSRA